MKLTNLMKDKIVESLKSRVEEQSVFNSIMLYCEQNSIDIDSLNEEELNEFVSKFLSKFSGGSKYKTSPELMKKFSQGGTKTANGQVRNSKTRDVHFAGGEKKSLQKGAFADQKSRKYLDAANLANNYKRKRLGMGMSRNLESMKIFDEKIIEAIKVGQIKPTDDDRTAALKTAAHNVRARKAMGPNNPSNTFNLKRKLNKGYISRGKKGTSEAPMSKDKINQSRGSGQEGAKASAHNKAFNNLVKHLGDKK